MDFAKFVYLFAKPLIFDLFDGISDNLDPHLKTIFEGCFLFCCFSIIAFENAQAQICMSKSGCFACFKDYETKNVFVVRGNSNIYSRFEWVFAKWHPQKRGRHPQENTFLLN